MTEIVRPIGAQDPREVLDWGVDWAGTLIPGIAIVAPCAERHRDASRLYPARGAVAVSRVIELINCPNPHATVRSAASAVPGLADALVPREVKLPDGKREVVQPGTVELPGARVHVIPLQQEMRKDGTITPAAAVVVVDGPDADKVADRIDRAIRKDGQVRGAHYERPDGVRVVLEGPEIANTGAQPRKPRAERLALRAVDEEEPSK